MILFGKGVPTVSIIDNNNLISLSLFFEDEKIHKSRLTPAGSNNISRKAQIGIGPMQCRSQDISCVRDCPLFGYPIKIMRRTVSSIQSLPSTMKPDLY
jgi:hypothetical protein